MANLSATSAGPGRRGLLAAAALLGVVLLAAPAAPAQAAEPIRVVASIPDFAALARVVGGDAVTVESIVKGNRDVHSVELLPSLLVKVGQADVFLTVGMDLDLWARQLVDGSRNASLLVVDLSRSVEPLEVPNFKVDASHGDLHRYGNPHYWLDPANSRPLARAVADALARIRPADGARFRAAADEYAARIDKALAGWQQRLARFKGTSIVSYHNSWPYFARRFDLRVVEFLEPKPGVPPTPTHVADVQELLRSGGARAILLESYFDDRVPTMLSRVTGVPMIKAPVTCGAQPGVETPEQLFEAIVAALEQALTKPTAKPT